MTGHGSKFEVNLRGKKVLSLDVFDTCLLRRVGHPIGVFEVVEQEIAQEDGLRWLSGGPFGFRELRAKAELGARERLSALQKTPEETFDEIYDEFARLAGVTPDMIERLKVIELDAERKLSNPNPEIRDLANRAASQGLDVIYISDMYLPGEFVLELLSSAGFPVSASKVFVSWQYRKAKWNGELYDVVSDAIGIPLRKFVHVGDNYKSDVVMARRRGITAYHYKKLSERVLEADRASRGLISPIARPEYSLALGIRDAVLASELASRTSGARDQDFWFDLGYRRVGILMLAFTLWLIDQAERDNIDKLVFLARDGHIMKQCLELVGEMKGGTIDSVYMYGSRRATWFPAMMSLEDDDVDFLIGGKYQKVRSYFERYGLTPPQFQRAVFESGFTSIDYRLESVDDWYKLKRAVKSLYMPILASAANESQLALKYLDQIGIPHNGRVGLVDIGWWGSMQEGFERLVQLSGRACQVTGYYVGTHEKAESRIQNGRAMKGFLVNLSVPEDINNWIYQCVGLLEFLFLAPHGTCLGFREVHGIIEPELDDNASEQENTDKAKRVHEGVLAFIKDARQVIVSCPHLVLDARGAYFPYAEVVMDPTPREAIMLGNLTQADGIGKSERVYFANPAGKGSTSARTDTGKPYWPIGYAKRQRKIPFFR